MAASSFSAPRGLLHLSKWAMDQIPDQVKGISLAVSSSLFIGASFIIKKKGLRIAGSSGIRAGDRHERPRVQVYSLSYAIAEHLPAYRDLLLDAKADLWLHRLRGVLILERANVVDRDDHHDLRGVRQFCRVCICACHRSYTARSPEHHRQVLNSIPSFLPVVVHGGWLSLIKADLASCPCHPVPITVGARTVWRI